MLDVKDPILFPLSLAQQDIYYDQIQSADTPRYNIGGHLDLPSVDLKHLQLAHQKVVDNNDAFGIRIVSDGEEVKQYISCERTRSLEVVDFSANEEPEVAAQNWLRKEFTKSFEVEDSELFKAVIIKLADNRFYYSGIAHHLILDGWGFANWAKQLANFYLEITKESSPDNHVSTSQDWQTICSGDSDYVSSTKIDQDRLYWEDHLKHNDTELFETKTLNSFREIELAGSGRKVLEVPFEKCSKLNELGREYSVSLAQIFQAIITVYLYRYYDKNVITLGVPLHNRRGKAQKDMIGVFTNVSPFQLKIDSSISFIEMCQVIAKMQRRNLRHQRFPVSHLKSIRSGQRRSSTPFSVDFNFLKMNQEIRFEDQICDLNYLSHYHEVTPLSITVWEGNKSSDTQFLIDYNHAYFQGHDIERLIDRIDYLIDQAIDDCESAIEQLSILPAKEAHLIQAFSQLNKIGESKCLYTSLHAGFVEATKLNRNKIALVMGEQSITYQALDQLTSAFASLLRNKFKLENGALIGVCLPRSIDFLATIISISKAGYAFFPIDINAPMLRKQSLLKDAESNLVIGTGSFEQEIKESNQSIDIQFFNYADFVTENNNNHDCDNALITNASGENLTGENIEGCLAYVIYTSGSTGAPKGVMVNQKAIGAHISDCIDRFSFASKDRVFQLASFSFDTFLEQTFAGLSKGATIHISENSYLEPQAFFEYVANNKITITDLTPAYLAQLIDTEYKHYWQDTQLDRVVVGGEALTPKIVKYWFAFDKKCRLFNAYGPTECVVTSTLNEVKASEAGSVSIGRPIGDRQILILDKLNNMVPIGAIGEIHIAGHALADGYWGNPELTKQKFVSNLHGYSRVYQTGDLGYFDQDGYLYFVGRKDTQEKIRGFRVELGEVEATLNQIEDISNSVVKYFKNPANGESNGHLVAFIVLNIDAKHKADSADYKQYLRHHLGQWLPPYMIPESLEFLDSFPLTENQKIDRKALREPKRKLDRREIVHAETETEAVVLSIWSELLEVEINELSVLDNFFELGGHSLLITKMIHRVSLILKVSVPSSVVFKAQDLKSLCQSIDKLKDESEELPVLDRQPNETDMPLSMAQFRIWFVEQFNPNTNENNISGGVRVSGEFNLDAIKQVITEISEKHEILRVKIIDSPEGPVQRLCERFEPNIHFLDKSSVAGDDNYSEAFELSHAHALEKIDLLKDPLASFLLIKLSHNDWVMSVRFHHIICDGWSLSLFVSEFVNLYENTLKPSAGSVNVSQVGVSVVNEDIEKSVSYLDFVRWQRQFENSEAYTRQKRFWKDYLESCNQSLAIPVIERASLNGESESKLELEPKLIEGHTQQAKTSGVSGAPINRFKTNIDSKVADKLRELATENKTSLFSLTYATVAIWISRLTGEKDFLIGIPVSGRNIPGTEHIFGSFINNLPARSQIDVNERFNDFAKRQGENLKEVLANQDLPFEEIIKSANLQRDESLSSVLKVFVNFLNIPDINFKGDCLNAKLLDSTAIDSKFDLTLYLDDSNPEIEIECVFNAKKYSLISMKILMSQYLGLVEQIVKTPELRCGDYSLQKLSINSSKSHLALKQNLPGLTRNQSINWPGPVHKLFEEYAQNFPENTAIEYDGLSWSYKALDLTCNYFASQLVSQGINKGDVVAILAERCDLLVVAVLAVFKAGGAYIMLSNDTPTQKLTQQIATLSPRSVITLGQTQVIPEIESAINQQGSFIFNINDSEPALSDFVESKQFYQSVDCDFDDLAYVSLSSGTEGFPKVIEGRHGSLTNYMSWMAEHFDLTNQDRFGMLSGLLHDPLQRDLFTPICLGATICIPSETEYEFAKVDLWLNTARVSIIHLTPSLANYVFGNHETRLSYLKAIFFAGEQLSYSQIESFKVSAPNVRIINLYGSTESSRAVSFYEPLSPDNVNLRYASIPVGKGIADVDLIVLNETLTPCGIGELGQIGIRSSSLTIGYRNDPTLTQQKFIVNPITQNQDDAVYLTGDLGRYLIDGNVIYEGRKDRQIKVRGFRVELAEIDLALRSLAQVENASCLVVENQAHENIILGFVVLSNSASQASVSDDQYTTLKEEIRTQLKQQLPGYMLPAETIIVAEMPLTVNGKLDSKKLLSLWNPSSQRELKTPGSDLEHRLLDIWQNLLGKQDICVEDNFFDIGGHSLLVTKLFSQLREEYQVDMEYKAFFTKNSIRELASSIEQKLVISRNNKSQRKKNKITI